MAIVVVLGVVFANRIAELPYAAVDRWIPCESLGLACLGASLLLLVFCPALE
jgi:hypothetical protein